MSLEDSLKQIEILKKDSEKNNELISKKYEELREIVRNGGTTGNKNKDLIISSEFFQFGFDFLPCLDEITSKLSNIKGKYVLIIHEENKAYKDSFYSAYIYSNYKCFPENPDYYTEITLHLCRADDEIKHDIKDSSMIISSSKHAVNRGRDWEVYDEGIILHQNFGFNGLCLMNYNGYLSELLKKYDYSKYCKEYKSFKILTGDEVNDYFKQDAILFFNGLEALGEKVPEEVKKEHDSIMLKNKTNALKEYYNKKIQDNLDRLVRLKLDETILEVEIEPGLFIKCPDYVLNLKKK